jgi:hypothetical protein
VEVLLLVRSRLRVQELHGPTNNWWPNEFFETASVFLVMYQTGLTLVTEDIRTVEAQGRFPRSRHFF